MEKQGIFIERILSNENMNRAYKQVKKNKGAAGIDGMECADLLSHLKVNGQQLRESIRNQSYKPMPVKRVEIPKADGSKRKLGIPTVTDRVVQQAATQVLTPIYERKFHENSYGFRPNHSVENAIARSYQLLQHANLHYVIEFDIKGFFDNVNHAKLIRQIWAMGIHDKALIFVLRRILTAQIKLEDGTFITPDKGTPQVESFLHSLQTSFLTNSTTGLKANGNGVRYAKEMSDLKTGTDRRKSPTSKRCSLFDMRTTFGFTVERKILLNGQCTQLYSG